MKSAKTKEKVEKFAKEIVRNPDLVYLLGLMQGAQTRNKTFVDFSEELQETWFEASNQERLYENLRKAVAGEVRELLESNKKLKYLTIAKISYIFTEKEFGTMVNESGHKNENIEKMFIIKELSRVLENAHMLGGEVELNNIIKSAKRIYSFAKREKGGKG